MKAIHRCGTGVVGRERESEVVAIACEQQVEVRAAAIDVVFGLERIRAPAGETTAA